MSDKKLLIGPKVRRLRLDQQLTQAQMAADLEISPAYLNLIEANQRPVTAQVLVKLAGAYDIDLPTFARDEGPEIAAALRQAFAAPGLRDHGLSRQDFEDMAKLSPEAVEAMLSLATRPAAVTKADAPSTGPALADTLDEAFPALETLAREIRESLGADVDLGLAEACPFKVEILPAGIMGHTLRRYDLHRRRLLLHRALTQAAQRFQIVVQFVLQTHREALDAAAPKGVDAAEARLQAANYVAGAVLMPAERMRLEAELDLLALAHDLDVTLPQVAQRLARLHPSVLISIDGAGRVFSERGLSAFPEWRGVLSCPDWAIYGLEGAEVARQQVVLPSGAGFDCHIFAPRLRSVGHGQSFPRRTYALALPMDEAAEGATRLSEGPYHGLNDIYRRDLRPYSA